jgi:hypothetical protein
VLPEQPDVRITVNVQGAPPCDLTLSYPLDPDHDAMLHAMHESGDLKGVIECRMHDNDYRLRDLRGPDGRVHGAWLYLRRHSGGSDRLVLCHWPGGRVTGSHAVPSRMTPEHREGQEYIARRGEDAGYAVELETSFAKGTRSDVVVRGTHTLAAEVQVSGIGVGTAMRRTRKATEAGACTAWFSSMKNPPWAFKVPTVQTNRREGMQAGGWTVSMGPRGLEWERCHPASRLERCPDGKGNWCGKWHHLWVPLRGLTVDDVVERVPAGGLVRLDTGVKQGTILTTPEDQTRWLEHVGPPAVPAQRRRPKSGAVRHSPYDAAKLRNRLAPQPSAQRRPSEQVGSGRLLDDRGHGWPITGIDCIACRRPLIRCEPRQRYHPECDPGSPKWTDADYREWHHRVEARKLAERGREVSERLVREVPPPCP